ncbi:MAG: ribulose-phosphate 3-epimerase [Clostridia bacterium]|nr:ribulose-phosphate 3-epimerase [Clostridia bacterium]
MKKIAPSFLAVDIWQAAAQIAAVEQAGCSYLHLDIMDGHFVPNISYGPGLLQCLRPHSSMIFDTHLMVSDAAALLDDFAAAGADIITVHVEACPHLDRILRRIHELGKKAGIVLNPATPLVMAEEALELADLVLLMSVNPGFGGQKFIAGALPRIAKLAALREEYDLHFLIEVDGGIDVTNAAEIAAAGADILVAGSAIFGKAQPAEAYLELTRLANQA